MEKQSQRQWLSEAKWEYACRAGTQTRFYWGDNPAYYVINDYAWYINNSRGQTHNVGLKHPNLWGLHDMLGTVFEGVMTGTVNPMIPIPPWIPQVPLVIIRIHILQIHKNSHLFNYLTEVTQEPNILWF